MFFEGLNEIICDSGKGVFIMSAIEIRSFSLSDVLLFILTEIVSE